MRAMSGNGSWTRREFVRRTALAGAGLALADAGLGDALALAAPGDVQVFRSRPDLRPPRLTVLHSGQTGAGELFLAPSSGPGQRGVLIVDNSGEVVYFHQTVRPTAMNFRPGRFHGKPVLTWWDGNAGTGLGEGTHVILHDSYRVLARLPAGGGGQSDLHEFALTPRNTALVTSYEVVSADLAAVGGPANGEGMGGIVQGVGGPGGAGQRRGDRRHRPGDRGAERARALRVAQPRPCRARRDPCRLQRAPARLLPRQLDRPDPRREPARLGAQHLGRLQGQPPHGRGAVAARRPAERLRDGAG